MNVQVKEADVAVSAKTKRILAFDLLRGYMLVIILIDHIELYPSGFDLVTGKGRLFVSAAEGFFFLSGLLIGLVYKRRLNLGMKFIFRKLWRRGFILYLASIFLTLFYVALAVYSNHPNIKYGLPQPVDWHHIIKETALMRYGFGWSDFLPRFAILMAFAPIAFYLVAKGKWWLMLAISLVIWHFRGNGFTWSWQLIFNSGIAAGFYWNEISAWFVGLRPKVKKYLRRSAYWAAGLTFAISYLSIYLLSFLNQHYTTITPWLRHLTYTWNNYNYDIWVYAQKWTLGPVRLVLFFLWFAVLFMLIDKYQKPISRYSYGFLELLGRNGLFVYIAHSFIVFGFKLFIPAYTNLAENFFITLAALVLLILITVFYKAFTSGSGFNKPDKISASLKKTLSLGSVGFSRKRFQRVLPD